MDINRVSLAFASYSDSDLDVFSSKNVVCMTGNPVATAPPVEVPDLGALQVAFHKALLNAANGGTKLTALKDEARDPLVTALRLNAAYVQSIPGLTLSMLLSTGYLAINTNHSQSDLDTPGILSIENGVSGELVAHLTPVANARSYQVKVLTADGKQLALVTSTQARSVSLTGLTPGVVYTLTACAIGGLSGQSDWSDPVSHMAT